MKKLLMMIVLCAVLCTIAAVMVGCAQPSHEASSPDRATSQNVVVGSTPEQYERVGLSKGAVDIHEDGYNTLGADGTYEWWYFDCSLDDGSSLVVTFYTRSMMAPDSELNPFVTLALTNPDGTVVNERVSVTAEGFTSSTEQCDITLGDCTARGDLKNYQVVFANDAIQATIDLQSNVQSWRPESGYRFYGDGQEYYSAWLCVVPEGTVAAHITYEGQEHVVAGTGYHDHNWGNHPVWQLQNDWYWGRVEAGPYVAINSYITAAQTYGFESFDVFMLAKDGTVIADDPEKVQFSPADVEIDEQTGIPIASTLRYVYIDGDTEYQVTYTLRKTILATSMLGALTDDEQDKASQDGDQMMYYRFIGDAQIDVYEKGILIESQTTDSALWELMYPGVVR
ncbi:MAG: hydroxyneurosporene dehydrogenase [Actinomycetia bacterium]|nr:hydroxyneurosporene dehydrogenase [Actinomycetes bacterium]